MFRASSMLLTLMNCKKYYAPLKVFWK